MFTNVTTLDLDLAGTAKAKQFLDDYQKRYGQSAPADYAVQGHDAVYAMAAAIRGAGGTKPADVRKALSELTKDSPGIDKVILPFTPFGGGRVFDQTFGGIQVSLAIRTFVNGQLKVALSQVNAN